MLLQPMEPMPVGGRAGRGPQLFPGFPLRDLPANANTHGINISGLECSRPVPGNGNHAWSLTATVTRLDHTNIHFPGGGPERRESMRLVEIVVIPETEIPSSSGGNPRVASQ